MHTPGIGRYIGPKLRPELFSSEGTSFRYVLQNWWFPAAPLSALPQRPPVSALVAVADGWTGSITLVLDGTSLIFSPRARTSVAEVLEELCRRGSRKGPSFQWFVQADGSIGLQADVLFDLLLTGTVAERLALPEVTAGQYAYTGSPAFGVWVPSKGLLFTGAQGVGRTGGQRLAELAVALSESIGPGAAVGFSFPDESGTITCHGTYAELVALEAELESETLDIALAGSRSGRVRVTGLSRDRLGQYTPDKCSLSVSVRAVSL